MSIKIFVKFIRFFLQRRIIDKVSLLFLGLSHPLFVSCQGLPNHRPPDFEIRYEQSGGMVPDNLKVVLNSDGLKYIQTTRGNVYQFSSSVSPEILDRLYLDLRNAGFDSIHTYERGVYDRGGVAITFIVAKRILTVLNGGQSFVLESDRERWRKIRRLIEEVFESEVKGHQVRVKLIWNLKDLNDDLAIYLNGQKISKENAQSQMLFLLPGQYELMVLESTSGSFITKFRGFLKVSENPSIIAINRTSNGYWELSELAYR